MREATLYECDLHQWVNSESEPRRREFREAVHTLLVAIADSQNLSASMLMKGGILLAIRYQGGRYTRDIDFSTNIRYQKFDEAIFLEEFKSSLINASTRLEYDLDCRLQSHHIQPANRPEASFPTLKLRVGYAPKQVPARHRRLLARQSSEFVQVDYSFNEETLEVEDILLTDGTTATGHPAAANEC